MAHLSQGLSPAQVQQRINKGQTNALLQKPSRSVREIIYGNVFTRFNAILGSLLAIIVIVGPWQDALFGIVLVVNTLIGIVQELRAKYTLDKLSLLNKTKTRAIRQGKLCELSIEEVVIDDLLSLYPGDQIPADGVLLEHNHLEVDESLLSGESLPLSKQLGDRLLSGSFVVAGNGLLRVDKVGPHSYAQTLSAKARRFQLVYSETVSAINTFLRYLSWLIPPLGIFLFLQQLQAHQALAQSLTATVAALVAMVPEGLVLLSSIAFAVGIITLGKHNVLVQELPAVEGLARIDTICFDKTGTLTDGSLGFERMELLTAHAHLEQALQLLMVSSFPNPTLEALQKAFLPPKKPPLKSSQTIPFSPLRKWSAVRFSGESWFLGAPDILLLLGHPLLERVHELSQQGFRVLLVGYSKESLHKESLPSALTPVGFLLLREHIRPEASCTLEYFKKEGVAIKIISGDNPFTVQTIARACGVDINNPPISGNDLPFDTPMLDRMVAHHTIFGRVTPQQKQAILASLKRQGHVVAMVGDGVNDVLALKEAAIGITVRSGSEAAKAVSQFVLLDNKFSTLPEIVAQGRQILANIERVSNLFLTKTSYAIVLALLIGIVGWPFPFLPRHLTLVGSLTIGIPAFFLAFRPNLLRYKPGFITRVLSFALPAGIVIGLTTFIADAGLQMYAPATLFEERSLLLYILTFLGFWVVCILSRPLNIRILLLLLSLTATFVIIISIPALRHFFALTIPSITALLQAALIVGLSSLLLEILWRITYRVSDPTHS